MARTRPLKRTNTEILNAIRNSASLDYQRRIPAATKANVQDTLRTLTEYRPLWNEFVDALVNRIGSVVVRNMSWENELAEFKQGRLEYGDTIEEIQVGLLRAHLYDPDRDYLERDLFGQEIPEVQTNFHTVNRQNFYKVSVNEPLLQRAFTSSENGLSNFVAALMQAPATSDNWDEFLLMCSLFAEYEANGGFWHVNVPDVRALSSDAADAKGALRRMRAMAETLAFPSTQYNAAKMPTFANRDDLVIFSTPEFKAATDVEALAAAFNIDRADMHGRVITIPEDQFGIDGAQAIMTTRDFFMVADQRLENTSQYNPVALHTNYFLHHWQVISASRFVPAVMFWTGPDDEVIEIRPDITSVAAPVVTDIDGETVTDVTRGLIYQAAADVTVAPDDTAYKGVRWTVAGQTSSKTFITQAGVLHVGGDEGASSLTVTATTTYLDPAGLTQDGQSANSSVTVSGDPVPEWPLDHDHNGDGGDDPEGQGVQTFGARTEPEKKGDPEPEKKGDPEPEKKGDPEPEKGDTSDKK